MLMRSFESDLEELRRSSEALHAKMKALKESETTPISQDVPRIIPEEAFESVITPIFQTLGTEASSYTGGSTYVAGVEPRKSSIFQIKETLSATTGAIFKPSPFESGIPIQMEQAVLAPPVPATPITQALPAEVPPAPTKKVHGDEIREELARIQGESEGLVAPPPTPTTGFLPIVQPTMSVSQVPVSLEGFSETLEVTPELIPPPSGKETIPVSKTYLIPCGIGMEPSLLNSLIDWTLKTFINPGDRVKLLISGELEGSNTNEGYISDFITNESFQKDKGKFYEKYPLLAKTIESTGLVSVEFQIEIRRMESLGWSLRSEFQWPHVNEQMIVVVPSHVYQDRIRGESFDSFILKASPCTVVEYK